MFSRERVSLNTAFCLLLIITCAHGLPLGGADEAESRALLVKRSSDENPAAIKCGQRPLWHPERSRQKRIIGGSPAGKGQWPWHVVLVEVRNSSSDDETPMRSKCGAALISDRHVLTAATCKPKESSTRLTASLGQHEAFEAVVQTIPVAKMIVHKHFNRADFNNDIALLVLEYPAVTGFRTVPICLPETTDDFTGGVGYVTGWGVMDYAVIPDTLQSAALSIIPRKQCEQMGLDYGFNVEIHDHGLCAGYEGGGYDACRGDSGGPLAVQGSNEQWVLAGLVSYGIGCAEPGLPGVYTNISYYKPWISQMMSLYDSVSFPERPMDRPPRERGRFGYIETSFSGAMEIIYQ